MKTKLVHGISASIKFGCIAGMLHTTGGLAWFSRPLTFDLYQSIAIFMTLSAAKDLGHFFAHGK